jgi:SAM-dependent methyltransferase
LFERIWEDQIALNSQDEPAFSILPPAEQLTDRTSYTVDAAALLPADQLAARLAADTAPLPMPEDREGYFGDRHFEYWLSGLQTALATLDFARRHGCGRGTYVELGSASGRVIRHLAAQRDFNDFWAFDINWRHICWMNEHLPYPIKAIQNSMIPTLPLQDASVDCVSAMSVFSHIETFELQWLAEIRRVLKPGGIALISLQTDHQLAIVTPSHALWEPLRAHPRWTEDFAERLEKAGKMVLRWHADRSYSSNVFYHQSYVRKVWSRLFDIVEYRHEYPDFQDFAILRRPYGN